MLDIPLLRDTDANPSGSGFYVALSSIDPNWPGAVLYRGSDGINFNRYDSSNVRASFGYALNALGAIGPGSPESPFSPWEWDTENTLTVRLMVGELASDTEENVINGSNPMILGQELIQFCDAVQNEDGSWTVSQLLRGRRGTDGACGTHAVGDLVILPLAGGLIRKSSPLSEIGSLRYYRAVTLGKTVDAVQSVPFTLAANDLKPWSPVDINAAINGSGDLVITWQRRTRLGGYYQNFGSPAGQFADGLGGPLSEASELYEIDILGGSPEEVLRTLSATSESVTYTAAQAAADFGSTPATIAVNVYQISAVVGRGSPGSAVIGAW
jgi:hypothetical protein